MKRNEINVFGVKENVFDVDVVMFFSWFLFEIK